MGFYINQNSKGVLLPPINKADYLILDGGKEIPQPKEWIENLVCVVENGMFDAAGYVYSKQEFEDWTYKEDNRPKRWIIYEHAKKLSGYE